MTRRKARSGRSVQSIIGATESKCMFDVRLLSFLIRGLNVNVRTPVCTHLRQNLPRCDLSVHTEHTRKRPPSANSPQATGGPGKNRSRGGQGWWLIRTEAHKSELKSIMRTSF